MTLSTPTKSRSRRFGGFTLVEMLVVIGIIILLVGILLPALNIAYSHSIKQRMRGDIQTISAALEQYRSDMRIYPQLDYNDTTLMTAAYPASVMLCQALINPQWTDTSGTVHPGPGFTAVPNGQVYGPYIEMSRFKLVQDPALQPNALTPGQQVTHPYLFIADRYSHPILYFKAFPGATPSGSTAPATNYVGYWTPTGGGPRPMYNLYDDQGSTAYPALCWPSDPSASSSNSPTSPSNALIRMCLALGDRNANGVIDGNEQSATKAQYLLWSAGPDEVFGIALSNGSQSTLTVQQGLTAGTWASQQPSCDDATNFTQ